MSSTTTTQAIRQLSAPQTVSVSGASGIRVTHRGGPDATINGSGFTFHIIGTGQTTHYSTPGVNYLPSKGSALVFLEYSLEPYSSGSSGGSSGLTPTTVIRVNGTQFQPSEGLQGGSDNGLILALPRNSRVSLVLSAGGLSQSIDLGSFKRGTEDPAILYRTTSQTQYDQSSGLPVLVDPVHSDISFPFGTQSPNSYGPHITVGDANWLLRLDGAKLSWSIGTATQDQIGRTPTDPHSAFLSLDFGNASGSSAGWSPPHPIKVFLTLPGQQPVEASQVPGWGSPDGISPGSVYWQVPASMTSGVISFSVDGGPSPELSWVSILVGSIPSPVNVSFES